ncbi:MAG TPA: GDYXXLXY domain-containing protein [Spirochaetota bacterium]|nr:GDYXXLXY domain-containing protein [Spirochaetota bacterium]HPP05232.1 GDYXXLXY domain-containing protein [Spirochaetota bacterium]
MKLNKFLFFIVIIFQFLIIILMLLYANTILGSEKIVRLKANLYDPYDFMKGRYINLSFDIENEFITSLPSIKNYSKEELNKKKRFPIYYILSQKEDGFYHVEDISFEKPQEDKIFIKTKIKDIYDTKIVLKINFREYYLQEDYALKGENILRSLDREKFIPNLILGVDKNGRTIQKGFFINEIPIEKFIKEQNK